MARGEAKLFGLEGGTIKMEWILFFLILFLEMIVLYYLAMSFCERKQMWRILSFILVMIGNTCSTLLGLEDTLLRGGLSCVLSFLSLSFAFAASWPKRLLAVILFHVLSYAVDAIMLILIMLGTPLDMVEIRENNMIYYVAAITAKLLAVTLSYVVYQIYKRKKLKSKLTIFQWLLIMSYSTCSMFSLYTTISVAINSGSIDSGIALNIIFIIFCNVAIFMIFDKIENDKLLREQHRILLERQRHRKIEQNC